jgi:hypothetical protein
MGSTAADAVAQPISGHSATVIHHGDFGNLWCPVVLRQFNGDFLDARFD